MNEIYKIMGKNLVVKFLNYKVEKKDNNDEDNLGDSFLILNPIVILFLKFTPSLRQELQEWWYIMLL